MAKACSAVVFANDAANAAYTCIHKNKEISVPPTQPTHAYIE